tara:strand:+ start:42 stop:146 length:105 start_codon:yes stop_codon:yes gene_type:complete
VVVAVAEEKELLVVELEVLENLLEQPEDVIQFLL